MNLIFYHKKRKFSVEAERKSLVGKMTGLMFRSRNTRNMLFSFGKNSKVALHSWFVFFPFLCLWLDNKMNVVEMEVVMPFSTRIVPKNGFKHVLELPFNDDNSKIIHALVGERFKYK